MGVTAFEIITGQLPFTTDEIMTIFQDNGQRVLPDLANFVPDILPELRRIIIKACQHARKDRYQDVPEVIGDLAPLLNQHVVDTRMNCSFYQKVQEEEHSFDTAQGNISLYAATHIGHVKKPMKIAIILKDSATTPCCLRWPTDWGGQAAGDYAAEILRGKLANMPLIPSGREEEVLSALAVETDRFILAAAEKDTTLEGMGTTLLCVFIREGRASWVMSVTAACPSIHGEYSGS
ncbi:hypothetical protein JCM39068_44050 [Desulfocastanea catecholica]